MNIQKILIKNNIRIIRTPREYIIITKTGCFGLNKLGNLSK